MKLTAMVWTTVCDRLASYDAASRRIYVCGGGGSGSVDVFEQADADRYRSPGRITTQPGAATGRLVAETGEYLVMAPAHAGKPAQVGAQGGVRRRPGPLNHGASQ